MDFKATEPKSLWCLRSYTAWTPLRNYTQFSGDAKGPLLPEKVIDMHLPARYTQCDTASL